MPIQSEVHKPHRTQPVTTLEFDTVIVYASAVRAVQSGLALLEVLLGRVTRIQSASVDDGTQSPDRLCIDVQAAEIQSARHVEHIGTVCCDGCVIIVVATPISDSPQTGMR